MSHVALFIFSPDQPFNYSSDSPEGIQLAKSEIIDNGYGITLLPVTIKTWILAYPGQRPAA